MNSSLLNHRKRSLTHCFCILQGRGPINMFLCSPCAVRVTKGCYGACSCSQEDPLRFSNAPLRDPRLAAWRFLLYALYRAKHNFSREIPRDSSSNQSSLQFKDVSFGITAILFCPNKNVPE